MMTNTGDRLELDNPLYVLCEGEEVVNLENKDEDCNVLDDDEIFGSYVYKYGETQNLI